jgi:hypothetical protein
MICFLILDFSFSEEFAQSWQHFREEYSKGLTGYGGASPSKGTGKLQDKGTGGDDVGKKDGKKGEESTPRKDGGRDPKPKPEPKPAKLPAAKVAPQGMDINTLWREGQKLKSKFQEASCTFVELNEKILSEPSWAWASGTSHGQLVAAQKAVKDKFSEWHKEFVMSPNINTFKKAYPTARAQTELVSFLTLLEEPISKLIGFCNSLQRAHAEMAKSGL